MYTIRGADNSEQGPLSARQVRDLILQRRAHARTLARADTENEWKALATFAEFQPALEMAGALGPRAGQAADLRTSRLALAAFCVSVFGFCGVTAIVGLLLGALALLQIRKHPATLSGTRFAAAAIVISIGFLVALPLTFSFIQNYGQRSFYRQMMGSCRTHVTSLATAVRILSIGNNGTFPEADSWCDAVRKEITTLDQYRCPNDTNSTRCSYAYNAKVGGAQNVDPKTVVIFEADLDWNGSGGPEDMITRPRHGGYVVVGLANGSIQMMPPEAAKKLRWDP